MLDSCDQSKLLPVLDYVAGSVARCVMPVLVIGVLDHRFHIVVVPGLVHERCIHMVEVRSVRSFGTGLLQFLQVMHLFLV